MKIENAESCFERSGNDRKLKAEIVELLELSVARFREPTKEYARALLNGPLGQAPNLPKLGELHNAALLKDLPNKAAKELLRAIDSRTDFSLKEKGVLKEVLAEVLKARALMLPQQFSR